MRYSDEVVVVPKAYRVEARLRARKGTPISGILRDARAIIERRGWVRRGTHPARTAGPVDVLTAVRLAAFDHLGAAPNLVDHYALLVPIAAAIKSSFVAWEGRPGLDVRSVLTMMDRAIAFAVQAEGPHAGPAHRDHLISNPRLN